MTMTSDDSDECPLCMEPFEVDDTSFYPCTCGYQICRFCWHRLKIDGNGLCPACRKPYSENPAHFEPLSEDEIIRIKKERRHKEVQKKQKLSENRRHLADVRVVQKNLVFVVGLSQRLADAEVLKKIEYFGKFGKIMKVVINSSPSYAGTQTPSASAYLTYSKPDEALRAIQTVNNIQIDNRVLKASLGTTKYCSHFLKGIQCPKTDCMYLHDLGEEAASFTKEQMSQGKHLDYESKLIELFLHIPRNLQNISTTTGELHNQLASNSSSGLLNTTIPVALIPTPTGTTAISASTTPAVHNSVSSSNLSASSNTNISSASNSSVTPSSNTLSSTTAVNNNSTNNLDKLETTVKSKSKTKSSSHNRTNSDKTSGMATNQIDSNQANKSDEHFTNEPDAISTDKEVACVTTPNNDSPSQTPITEDFNVGSNFNANLESLAISHKLDKKPDVLDTKNSTDFSNYLHSQISNTTYKDNAHLTCSSSNPHSILNGRLDNVLLNNFSDSTLQQEEDLGFDPWGESTKALQDLMKMEKVTNSDQLENYENLMYLKTQTLNQNLFNLKLSNQEPLQNNYNAGILDENNSLIHQQRLQQQHQFQRPLSNGQIFDNSKLNSSLKADPVKLNPSLAYNSLPSVINASKQHQQQHQQQQNHRESLNDPNVLFQNSLLMNNGLMNENHNSNKFNELSAAAGHFNSESLEYFNQENLLNKMLLKNNLSKVIVPPPGFNSSITTSNTFNSPISTSSTNSSSSSTSSSVNNSTSTTPALNSTLINQAKQIAANSYQINDIKKINDAMARSLKNKENDCNKLNNVSDFSSQECSLNKNSFNLNSDENLIHSNNNMNTPPNMMNISKSLQETFRSIFPNAHISFGNPNTNQKLNSIDNQASNFQNNKNQYMIDDQLLKRNCWPDDPAIVSLNDGSNECNNTAQRLNHDKIQQECVNNNMFSNHNQPDLSFLAGSQVNNINFNNLLRKQNEQQMNSNLLNQFQLLYQQHQLAQLNALKSKQTQNFKANQEMNNKLMNSNNNMNNMNTNFFQNMNSNLNNINAIYNNHNAGLIDNYMSGVNDLNNFNTNSTNLNNFYLIDSNQNIQTTNLNKNNLNVSSLSLPQQNFMQQFISSITPNSNSD